MMRLSKELIHARTCYKHLAGELGIAITRSFLSTGLVKNFIAQNKHCFSVTTKGRRWCVVHHIGEHNDSKFDAISQDAISQDAISHDVISHDTIFQGMTKSCLDHSHREPHIAGELGRAIFNFMLANNYCERAPGRHILVTESGIHFLQYSLGIRWSNHFGGGKNERT